MTARNVVQYADDVFKGCNFVDLTCVSGTVLKNRLAIRRRTSSAMPVYPASIMRTHLPLDLVELVSEREQIGQVDVFLNPLPVGAAEVSLGTLALPGLGRRLPDGLHRASHARGLWGVQVEHACSP